MPPGTDYRFGTYGGLLLYQGKRFGAKAYWRLPYVLFNYESIVCLSRVQKTSVVPTARYTSPTGLRNPSAATKTDNRFFEIAE